MTTPQLLYQAVKGKPMPIGPHRCFWCGATCDDVHRAKDHVSSSFVGYSEVVQPASEYVCGGCVLATDESNRAYRPRQASWIITESKAERLGWGDLERLREACVNPPKPPFAVVLAVSGQKHLLYRAPVNLSRGAVTAQHELSAVTFSPVALAERINLAKAIAAATGKPTLSEPPRATLATALFDYYENPEPYLRWLNIWCEPLSQLAAYFTPKKELCQNEYQRTRSDNVVAASTKDRRGRLPAHAGGTDGPGLFGG